MAGDMAGSSRCDRERIDIRENSEIQDWSVTLEVSQDLLKDAIARVGPMVVDVAKALGRQLWQLYV